MDKCNVCGLEKNQHTQLPHRFVAIPPNPDQGVLFDVDFALRRVEDARFDALDSLQYVMSTPKNPSLKKMFKECFDVNLMDWQENYLTNTFDWADIVDGWDQISSPTVQDGFKFEDRKPLEYDANTILASERVYMIYARGHGKTQASKEWLSDQMKKAVRTPPSTNQLRLNVIDESMGEFVPKAKRMQAKDIPTDRLVKLINDLNAMGKSTHLAALCDAWPHIPYKVLQAKLRRLERKGTIEGCYCGCSTQNRVLTNAEKESRFQLKREEWLRQIRLGDE